MKLDITRVLTTRDRIVDKLADHVGIHQVGDDFNKLVDDLYLAITKTIDRSVLQESVSHLINQELSPKLLQDTAWRLSANLKLLEQNKVVYPWKGQSEKEWMPVQVLSVDKTKTMNNEIGYKLKLRFLSGPACPLIIYKTWTAKMCSYFASKIGFSPSWKNSPYRDGKELTSMRFLVEVDPKLCRDRQPGFENFDAPPSLQRWNKDILKARSHVDPPCPFDFLHFCYQCPVGYDKCKAGTHPKTYEAKFCAICNADTWHDPAQFDICVSCKEESH